MYVCCFAVIFAIIVSLESFTSSSMSAAVACNGDEYRCVMGNGALVTCVSSESECECLGADCEVEVVEKRSSFTGGDAAETCQKDSIFCVNAEKNATECLSLKTVCSSFPEKILCENHKEIGGGIIENLCKFYDISSRRLPFECGSDIYISKDMVCDGNADCPDGSDESYSLCSQIQCEFKCNNNECTLNKYLCDGINQCTSGDDEMNCRNSSLTSKFECNSAFEFECQSSMSSLYEKHCINKTDVCDSVRNCMDGSDEWPSVCLNANCTEFRCDWNGACLDIGKVCDGVSDCSDSSDEKNCLFTAATDESFYCTFRCNNESCLHDQQLCDRYDDCEDGEDEKMCNYTLCSKSAQLCGRDSNALCKVRPYFNYTCDCKNGFKYDQDSKSCFDVDECDLGKCTHKCINTHGSYQCECNDGFFLKYGHCIANYSPAEANVLFSDQNRVFKFNLFTNYSELLFQSDDIPMANFKISDFDYEFNTSLLFFTEYHTHSIYMYSWELKTKKLIFQAPNATNKFLQYKVLLAYDWIHRNLYFNFDSSIYVAGPISFQFSTGFSVQKVISHTFELRSLVVSPDFKSLFWIDVAFGTIESSRLDGSDRRILVKDVVNAQGLTIDHTANRLYWLDINNGFVATCDLNGNNYFLVVQHTRDKLVSITSFEKTLYYLHNNRIKTVQTDSDVYRRISDKLVNRLIQTDNSNVIHFYSELSQPVTVVSPCNCGSCLCIPVGDALSQDTKCICKALNITNGFLFLNETDLQSIDETVSSTYVVINSTLKLVGLVAFVGCFLLISISFRLKPPLWLLKSIDNTKDHFYSIRFVRKRSDFTERGGGDCNASIHTANSVVDLENDLAAEEKQCNEHPLIK